MISQVTPLNSMSKLHDLPRAEKPQSTAGRHRSMQAPRVATRPSELRRVRGDVALDMIGHILRVYFRIDAPTEKERIIQW